VKVREKTLAQLGPLERANLKLLCTKSRSVSSHRRTLFYDMYYQHFRETNGKDEPGLQHIIEYYGLCRERLGKRERTLCFHIIHISENI
jgi:hypothetical protein